MGRYEDVLAEYELVKASFETKLATLRAEEDLVLDALVVAGFTKEGPGAYTIRTSDITVVQSAFQVTRKVNGTMTVQVFADKSFLIHLAR